MGFSFGETVASALVKEAVNLIRVAAEREVGLLCSFKDDLTAMGNTLETINAALKDADAAPTRDERTRLLLGRLKAAAHDIEDLLEEFADAGTRGRANWFCKVMFSRFANFGCWLIFSYLKLKLCVTSSEIAASKLAVDCYSRGLKMTKI